jgi:hypothetical protein
MPPLVPERQVYRCARGPTQTMTSAGPRSLLKCLIALKDAKTARWDQGGAVNWVAGDEVTSVDRVFGVDL